MTKSRYDIGDIVYSNDFQYIDGTNGEGHCFVIISEDEAIDINYFALLISSNLNKLKFPYNVLLPKDANNNLDYDSIVKCDNLINLKHSKIEYCIGKISQEQLILFTKKYLESRKNKKLKKQNDYTEEEMKSIRVNQQKESTDQEVETDDKKEGESIN